MEYVASYLQSETCATSYAADAIAKRFGLQRFLSFTARQSQAYFVNASKMNWGIGAKGSIHKTPCGATFKKAELGTLREQANRSKHVMEARGGCVVPRHDYEGARAGKLLLVGVPAVLYLCSERDSFESLVEGCRKSEGNDEEKGVE